MKYQMFFFIHPCDEYLCWIHERWGSFLNLSMIQCANAVFCWQYDAMIGTTASRPIKISEEDENPVKTMKKT